MTFESCGYIYLSISLKLINKLKRKKTTWKRNKYRKGGKLTEPRLQEPSLLRGVRIQFCCVICGIRAIVLRLFLQKADMAIQVGRGAGRWRPVANAEVLGMLQRVEARMDAME